MPNNEEMTGIAKPAYRPPNALWNGTDIRLQTEFLISSRLKPALEAGGSSLKNAIKAQVYLTNINDLPEFLDVWNGHFGDHPCALTVVATKGLALVESILEINIFGLRDGAKIKKQIIDHKASQHMRLGPAAVRAGDLLCLSALYAADADGAIPQVRDTAGLKYFGAPAHHEMRAILTAAGDICRAAGALDLEPAARQSLRERSQRRLIPPCAPGRRRSRARPSRSARCARRRRCRCRAATSSRTCGCIIRRVHGPLRRSVEYLCGQGAAIGLLPPPLAGEGWGRGRLAALVVCTPPP